MKNPPNTIVRNGTYYLHVRVPSDLLASYGKRFITKSLGTNKKSEACQESQRRMTVLRDEFKEKLAAINVSKDQDAAPTPVPTLSFAEIARQHAREVSDEEFAERARIFEAVTADDTKAFWKGKVVSLPESRYFDHLVEDGDLDKIVGYIVRTRIKNSSRNSFVVTYV